MTLKTNQIRGRIMMIVALTYWISIHHLASQKTAEEILALPKDQQLHALWFADNQQLLKDTLATFRYYEELISAFADRRAYFLEKQAFLAQLEFSTIQLHLYRPYGIELLNQAIGKAKKNGWKEVEAECYLRKGLLYYRQRKYGPAFEYIQRGYHQLKQIGFDQCPLMMRHLEEIGLAYYEFGDPEGAIHFLREALALKPVLVDEGEKRKTLNTIAVCFNQLEQYDSSLHYFSLAHEESVMVNDTFWAALTNGNKANVYFLQGKYEEAIPLMEMDFKQSVRFTEWPSAVNAAMTLATIYLKKEDVGKTEYYLDFAKKHKNAEDSRHMAGFYKNLAGISRLKGNYAEAFDYIDSFLVYKDRYEKEKNSKIINQAKLKVEVDQHASEIKLLETARSRQVLIRNGLLLMLALTGLFAAVIVFQQRARQQKERQLAALRQQSAETALENAKKQLGFFTDALKEKNELVESFRHELEIAHQSGLVQSDARTEHIQALLNSTILTEEEWKTFRQMFDLVHPGFFIRLKEKLSDLTPAETRLLALTKLQLAPKEMAAMLGISYDAIKKTRQRLRKKINLPEEGSLDELVDLI